MGGNVDEDGRPQWDNKAQFLLTCIGFAVGLGNVWRFPYQLQSNGGGAFLIPYLIMLVFEGFPLLYLELSVGQWLRQGSVGAWKKLSPYLVGVGVCSMFVSLLVGMFYNTIIAWCIWYMCNSFQETLPWNRCPVDTASNNTAYVQECQESSNTEYFWYRETLNISPSIAEPGFIQPHLLASLILAWLIVALCVIKGIASSGKVVYFTATFPYVVLFCFLVRGLTLKGSGAGLQYLFSPDISLLSDPQIWLTAATQIFFSLSLAFGGMIAFSSYNARDSDVELDTFIVCITNSATSLLASVVIFAVLGFKATVDYEECANQNIQIILNEFDLPEQNITIDTYEQYLTDNNFVLANGTLTLDDLSIPECSVTKNLDEGASGTGLAFIVFADAILEMPGSPFWAILFFLMLLTLGLDSMFGNIEGVLTPLNDLGLTKRFRNEFVVIGIILVSFIVSLTFVIQSGNYWLDVFNEWAGSLPLLIIAFFELIAVGWIYRYDNFDRELSKLLPPRNNIFRKAAFYFWWATIPVISPLLLLAVFIYYLYDSASRPLRYMAWQPEGYNISLPYPDFALAIIVIITLSCTIWIPLGAVYQLIRTKMCPTNTKSAVSDAWAKPMEGNTNQAYDNNGKPPNGATEQNDGYYQNVDPFSDKEIPYIDQDSQEF